MKYFWLFLFHSSCVAILMFVFMGMTGLWPEEARLGLSLAFGLGSGLGQVTLTIIKDGADEMFWHWLWLHYHLTRSTRYMQTDVDGKIGFGDHEAYHKHHFARYWYHSQRYQKLNPEGMKRIANKSIEKAFPKA